MGFYIICLQSFIDVGEKKNYLIGKGKKLTRVIWIVMGGWVRDISNECGKNASLER